MKRLNRKTLCFLILITFITLESEGLKAQMFVEEQVERNLSHVFTHINFNGGGVAFVDLDNDGDDDIYLNGGADRDRILENDGNGYFTEIGWPTGIEITDSIYTAGIIYGDVNNDGYQDLFVNTHFSDHVSPWTKNLLFINNGDFTFTEIWPESTDKSMTMGSVFLDYDLDGDLDIYNVNYVEIVKFTYDENNAINGFDHDCFKNYMYKNNGDGTFEDVTDELGLGDTGCALVVTATDFDSDGDLDIMIGNDFGPFIEPNKLYRNDLEIGKFTEVGMSTNCDDKMFSMGIAIGDYDNDLDLDYYISNLAANILLDNENGSFNELAEHSGVQNTLVEKDSTLSVSWGNFFADVNNDMYLDLFVANGYVPAPAFVDNSRLDPDKLYINNGNKTFTALDSIEGIWNDVASRGCAYSDVNNDGKIDIYSVVFDKPTFGLEGGSCLFMNHSTDTNNFIKIKLEGTEVNRSAFGSKIYVYTQGKAQMRELSGGASFCSHNSSTLHFGLAEYDIVDSIKVIWTGGKNTQTIYNLPSNQSISIKEKKSTSNTNLLSQNISIFPNPTDGLLSLKNLTEKARIEIIDNSGRIILETMSSDHVDLRSLESGIYFLRIASEETHQIFKFVKF